MVPSRAMALLGLVSASMILVVGWHTHEPTAPTGSGTREHPLAETDSNLDSVSIDRSPASEAMPSSLSSSDSKDQPPERSRQFPEYYQGIRDKNMLVIFDAYKGSVEYQAGQLADADLQGLSLTTAKERFVRQSVYMSLIQSQRLWYCSYEPLKGKRPPNTADVVYHQTAMGGLNVIFEITRAEFPEVFEMGAELSRLRGEGDSGRIGNR